MHPQRLGDHCHAAGDPAQADQAQGGRPGGADAFFYRNARHDEVVYVTRGGGVLESQFGNITYREGDYLVIPRGIIHRLGFR